MAITVMFVCLGNICRSPTAHGLFQARVDAAGLSDQIEVLSAGTGGWHVGKPPDPRALKAAEERGVDLAALRAQQFIASDFDCCDYVLAMDQQNLEDLRAMAPADFDGVLDYLLSFNSNSELLEVPDPYYGGAEGFTQMVELIDSAVDGLLHHICEYQLGGQ